jgi:hypothetical protein
MSQVTQDSGRANPECREAEQSTRRIGLPVPGEGTTGSPRHINKDLLCACRKAIELLNRAPTTRAFSHVLDDELENLKDLLAKAELQEGL